MSKKTDALHDAVLRKDLAAVKDALVGSASVETRDRDGRTPLASAVLAGDPHIVAALLDAGADVNNADKQGFSPLHHAAQQHSVELVRLLLDAGAEVNKKDFHGNSPLFRAVFESRGRKEVIAALLAAGADQHLENNSGVSPRMLASSIANFDVLSLLPEIRP